MPEKLKVGLSVSGCFVCRYLKIYLLKKIKKSSSCTKIIQRQDFFVHQLHLS
jgi:hypothetical protein